LSLPSLAGSPLYGVSLRCADRGRDTKIHMSMSSPYVIVLTDAEDRTLTARLASGRTEYRDWLRAQIVLAAARGGSNAEIAEQLPIGVDTVRRWRRRFATATGERLESLTDRPRSGRPPVHGPAVRAVSTTAVALACALPAEKVAGREGRAAIAVELPADRL
jgi:Helix-turn-helix domain